MPIHMEGKYVVTPLMFGETAILFGKAQNHSDFKDMRPVRAGFFRVDTDNGVSCWGKSTSLKLESEPEMDEMLIRSVLRMNRPY